MTNNEFSLILISYSFFFFKASISLFSYPKNEKILPTNGLILRKTLSIKSPVFCSINKAPLY